MTREQAIEVLPSTPRTGDAVRRLVGGGFPVVVVSAVLLVAVATLVAGLGILSGDRLYSFQPSKVIAGVSSQLGATLLPGLLISLVVLVNVMAGAVAVRLLAGVPFRGPGEAALGGFAGAVLLDAASLYVLGSAGLFSAPALIAVHAVVFAAGVYARPVVLVPRLGLPRNVPLAWWPLVVLVWTAPLYLLLASPAVPFLDVLPNHVAPVEHLRAFGSFTNLTIVPSPIYGPSRLFLGYVALLGNASVLTGAQAVQAVAAFGFAEVALAAIGAYVLARGLLGLRAGYWGLLTFPIAFAFIRLPDVRATVVVLPLAVWAMIVANRVLADVPSARTRGRRRGAALQLSIALAAAMLVHPAIGAFCAATVALTALLRAGRLADVAVPAIVGAGIAAIPQLATMLEYSLPSWIGVVFLALGLAACWLLASPSWSQDAIDAAGRVLLAAGAPVLIAAIFFMDSALADAVNKLGRAFPLLGAAAVGACFILVLGPVAMRRRPIAPGGLLLIASGVAVSLAATAALASVPHDGILMKSLAFEIPKTLGYWTPVLLAAAAAGLLGRLTRGRLAYAGVVATAAFLVMATLPVLRARATPLDIVEHPYTQSIAVSMGDAESGYWTGYPDAHTIIDGQQQEIVDALRGEERAARLGPATPVLHIATSFQQWSSIPLGVFTGAMETTVTYDPERSIHTAGGRLFGFDSLPDLLATSAYVVYEPAGLMDDYRPAIENAGFHAIYSNSVATVYVRR